MFKKAAQFLREVQAEMSKVSWPTRDELTASTGIVLAVSFALAVFIYIADLILSFLMNQILI